MTNNDILRRFRYALDIRDDTVLMLFELAGEKIDRDQLVQLLKKPGEPGYVDCSDQLLAAFLDGLISHERGVNDAWERPKEKPGGALTNNIILKKLRIALNYKAEDMLAVFSLAGVRMSKSQLSALFRKEGHKQYKICGDQFLRNFLTGLTLKYRGK